jgi:dienelactone hydrolase
LAIRPLLMGDSGPITQVSAWQDKRRDIITRLFGTLGSCPVPRDTHDIELLSQERCGTDPQRAYTRHKLRYVVGQGDEVYAYLLVPEACQVPAPAVVAMHQYTALGKDEVAGMGGDPDMAYGHELAQRGYVVLIPDYLTGGERAYPGVGAFVSAPFYDQYPNWSMVGKNVEDSMAAVDVLHTLDEVDTARIGVIGHSHGGHNAIFAAALDARISVCASNCGMSVLSEEEQRMEWCNDAEDEYNYIPALKPYFEAGRAPPFDLHEVAALIAPRPWLNISAYWDSAYGDQTFLAETGVMLYGVYALYQKTDAFAYLMHGNGHSFPRHSRDLAYAWLDRYLQR